jgi:hypothetical protein
MTKREMTEAELEALFEAQRDAVPPPSAAFLARIAEDARRAALTAGSAAAASPAAAPRRAGSVWAWLLPVAAPGGVVAAGLLGLWIGLADPQTIPDPALLWSDADDLSVMLSDDWYGLRDLDSMEWDDG